MNLPVDTPRVNVLDLHQRYHEYAMRERHGNYAETRYWTTQYKTLANEATHALDLERTNLNTLQEALQRIAVWGEGAVVGSHFDEPNSASVARDALIKIGIPAPGEKL